MSTFPPFDALIDAGHHLLAATATALAPVGGVTAAVVVLTLATRLLLVPLRRRQVASARAQAALAPQLQALSERHRDDPQRLAAETTALYREAQVSPLGGCLPTLIQAPVLTVLYRIFADRSIAAGPAALPGHAPFGVPLDTSWLAALRHGAPATTLLVLGGVLLALCALAWWSGRVAARAGGSTLVRLVPFTTVLVAAVAPLAVDVYLLTTMAWSAVEEPLLRRRDR